MSLIPTVFRSTDPGAPILTGTAGSFAALMDAVLINGYGSGAGAKPSLGWTLEYTAGAKRAYRNRLSEGGTGMYWRIDDSNAQYALCSAFHTMSGIDAGIDGFGGGSNAWGKSVSANTVVRDWIIVGNSRSAYVFLRHGNTTWGGPYYTGYFVGDYCHLNHAFAFNFAISHSSVASVAAGGAYSSLLYSTTAATGVTLRAARSHDGATVDSILGAAPSIVAGSPEPGAVSGLPYPYPPTGAMLVSRSMLRTIAAPLLWTGYLPGLWVPEHVGVLTSFTEYLDVAGLPSNRMLAIQSFNPTARASQGLIDIGQPWTY